MRPGMFFFAPRVTYPRSYYPNELFLRKLQDDLLKTYQNTIFHFETVSFKLKLKIIKIAEII